MRPYVDTNNSPWWFHHISRCVHHHHQQGLSMLPRSALKQKAVFFLAFLDHVFLSVESIKFAWKLHLMTSAGDPVSVSFFRVLVYPTYYSNCDLISPLLSMSHHRTVFAHPNTGIVGSNPTPDMDVCVRLFCVCVLLCVDGLNTVQGVLPTVYRLRNRKSGPKIV
jgi:hypothetical protein